LFAHTEGGRLRVFENRVLRRIFGPKTDELTEEWRKLHMRSLIICTAHPVFLSDKIEKNENGRACSTYRGEERFIQGFGGET